MFQVTGLFSNNQMALFRLGITTLAKNKALSLDVPSHRNIINQSVGIIFVSHNYDRLNLFLTSAHGTVGRTVASYTDGPGFKSRHWQLSSNVCFLKMGQPRPLFHLFSVFSNKHHYSFYNKYM